MLIAVLVAGCGGAEDDLAGSEDPAGSAEAAEVETAESEPQDDEDASAGDGEAGGEYLDELYAEALHEGVETVAAGAAFIEVDGYRLDFDELECVIDETADAERLEILAKGDTAEGPADLRIQRKLGAGGWAFEEELVQLTLIGGTPERELNSITMVQQQREEPGSDPDWLSGDGPSPLVRIVGDDVTATGTVDRVPFAEDPVAGEFTAAANCG